MQRQRLTITLDTTLLEALDSLVDGDILRNRSQAIEHYLGQGIGLNELNQVFLFFGESWNQAHLESVLRICQREKISELFICLPSQSESVKVELLAIIQETASRGGNEHFFTTKVVPLDFGSGAAILLQKPHLEGPFLLCWFSANFSPPSSFIQPYLFHKKHGDPLTMFLSSPDGLHYDACGLAIAQPDILQVIPAGVSNLEENIFPQLLKEGKVRGYAIH